MHRFGVTCNKTALLQECTCTHVGSYSSQDFSVLRVTVLAARQRCRAAYHHHQISGAFASRLFATQGPKRAGTRKNRLFSSQFVCSDVQRCKLSVFGVGITCRRSGETCFFGVGKKISVSLSNIRCIACKMTAFETRQIALSIEVVG